jgi:hypothetical protein
MFFAPPSNSSASLAFRLARPQFIAARAKSFWRYSTFLSDTFFMVVSHLFWTDPKIGEKQGFLAKKRDFSAKTGPFLQKRADSALQSGVAKRKRAGVKVLL